MAFVSDLRGMPIIDEGTPAWMVLPEGMGRGYVERDWEQEPFGALASPFPLPVIPRSEWTDRVEEITKKRARLSDVKERVGFKSLDQNGTNYCWINGPTQAIHYLRAQLGLPHVLLSPASVGAKIKNFRNVGGWGSEGLRYIIEHGIVPQSLWPANAIDKRYDTPEADAARKLYRCTEWWETKPSDFDQLFTCLLLGIPAAVGYNWWGHEVCAINPVVLGKDTYGIEIDNSWGEDWGDRGHGILTEAKGTPDEAVCPRVVTGGMDA